ncbi:MAG: hypothetical protein AABW87_03680, partial [Nanoarchaeota archaeon]
VLLVTAQYPEVRRNATKIFSNLDKHNLKGKREVFIYGTEENPEILFDLPVVKIPAKKTGVEKPVEVIKETKEEEKSDTQSEGQTLEKPKQKREKKAGFFRRLFGWFFGLF